MPYQIKAGSPVESLHLQTVAQARDAEKMLYDMLGYRGSFSTTQHVDGEGVVTESARLDLVVDGGVRVSVSLGEVILYRASPPEVVACVTEEFFAEHYEETV